LIPLLDMVAAHKNANIDQTTDDRALSRWQARA
jgi:hypothetical protein